MWYFIAYMLFCYGKQELTVDELWELHRKMYVRYKISFCENVEVLKNYLRKLASLGFVVLQDNKIIVHAEKLQKLIACMEEDSLLQDDQTYYLAYLWKRVQQAMRELLAKIPG
ncbi:MAG: hypothetical protein GXO42_00345 [bacterium]|nr:hypothetical protein [bacterium]